MFNPEYQNKVNQLTAMRDFERKQAKGQQYGAHLEHWSGSAGKGFNLDADALQALIDHYYRMDSIERYEAAKQAANAEGGKDYTYCVDTYPSRYAPTARRRPKTRHRSLSIRMTSSPSTATGATSLSRRWMSSSRITSNKGGNQDGHQHGTETQHPGI